jgi:hypothetical protein
MSVIKFMDGELIAEPRRNYTVPTYIAYYRGNLLYKFTPFYLDYYSGYTIREYLSYGWQFYPFIIFNGENDVQNFFKKRILAMEMARLIILAYRKNQSNPDCHIARLPKEILKKILNFTMKTRFHRFWIME